MQMMFSLPVVVLLVSSTGWGLTWLPLRYFDSAGLEGPPLIFIAFASAVMFLFPVFIRQIDFWKSGLHLLLLITVFGGIANLSFQSALYYGDVVRVMILFYLLPIWSVLGGRIFLGESIDKLRIVTLASAIGGGFLILGGMQIFTRMPDMIDMLAILSGFAFAMNNLVFRAAQSIPVISKVTAMFIGVAFFAGIFLLFDEKPLNLPEFQITFLAVLYGVLWLTLITFGTQWGVTHLDAGRASIIIVMELVVAVISAVIILNQTLSAVEMAGAALVIVAALLEGGREDQGEIDASTGKMR
jgi:drug/metabolite transporter (DMT)-like permease